MSYQSTSYQWHWKTYHVAANGLPLIPIGKDIQVATNVVMREC